MNIQHLGHQKYIQIERDAVMLENPGRNLSFSGAYDLYDLYDLRLSHLQRLTFSGQVLPLAPSLSSASKRSAITP